MEIIIVLCLLVVIYLLLQDRIILKKTISTKISMESLDPETSDTDIIGRPKIWDGQNIFTDLSKTDENDEKFFDVPPDFEEEEEDWRKSSMNRSEQNLAQGVTFEELSFIDDFLHDKIKNRTPEPSLVSVVHKIHGTELHHLLENSIRGASEKITELIEKSLNNSAQQSSIISDKNDLQNFDIREFI